jgi:hypothetical protein
MPLPGPALVPAQDLAGANGLVRLEKLLDLVEDP